MIIMGQIRRLVRFTKPNAGCNAKERHSSLVPERAIRSSHIVVWLGLTIVLWLLIVALAKML